MGAALPIRDELTPEALRRRARHEPSRRAALRMLAIANALEGRSRAEAARRAGMERQALRDAVLRYNAEGPDGLHDRPRSGRPEGLTPGQQAALKAWVLRGPNPGRDKVSAWRLVDIAMDKAGAGFSYALNRQKLRQIRRREGRYLLRTNLTENDPALLWQEAFKNLKGDLAIRPIFHQGEHRVEAHIFIAFLAYCLQITLQRRLHALAPGLTARSALEKFAAVQMIDVHLPTTDGRELLLTRYTQPEPELQLLIQQLKLSLPPQPPPRIATAQLPSHPL